MSIRIVEKPISADELRKIAQEHFGDMVKGVVDLTKGIIALGGELHADAETLLLEAGSEQRDLWGFNIYIDKPIEERVVCSSLINIRPSQGNRAMEVQDFDLRQKITDVVNNLTGQPG